MSCIQCDFGPVGASNLPTISELSASSSIAAGGAAEFEFRLPYGWTADLEEAIRLSWTLGTVLPSEVTLTCRLDLYDGVAAAPIRSVPVGDINARSLASFECGDQTQAQASCIKWAFPRDPTGGPLRIGKSIFCRFVVASANANGGAAVTDLTVTIPVRRVELCDDDGEDTRRPDMTGKPATACMVC